MLLLLGVIVLFTLLFLALFAVAPIFWSCVASLLYTLTIFLFNERHHVHNAQEFENRFWTLFAVLFSTALFFAKDSPLALGAWSPSLGFLSVLLCGYAMHVWDRSMHRLEMSKLVRLKRGTATSSLNRLQAAGIPIEDMLSQLNECLSELDQTYIPSTINNWFYKNHVLRKEKEITTIFEEAEPSVLNYLICNSKLGLIFYKVKDHKCFKHKHRTQLIELLAIERISQLNVHSKVIVLHSLQTMKLPANVKAEYCVKNIIVNTRQDDLSELKTLMDSKGDYWCMNKLVFYDIKSEIVRNEILLHIQCQGRVQLSHMAFNTRRSKNRKTKFWRKVLSDVDDTLSCSGGSYPSGIDKRYGKKVVYPGVLGFYRELDLGIDGPEEWPKHTVGNLVFLSARPHVYKDMTEKVNHAKFAKLAMRGMHTTPSLLPGDLLSGVETIFKNDFEPLARKKFENFQQYVAIYPEFKHVFVCDNGQGDVRAAQMMVEAFPKLVEAIYVQEVQEVSKTYKYDHEVWKTKPVKPYFFKTYTEAALHAATRNPPLVVLSGLRRICEDTISDFYLIQTKQWPSQHHKWDRHDEINQSLCYCNEFLEASDEQTVPLLEAERLWKSGEKVKTPYGRGEISSFDPIYNMYEVELDWRSIDVQRKEYIEIESKNMQNPASNDSLVVKDNDGQTKALETVFEAEEDLPEINSDMRSSHSAAQAIVDTSGDQISGSADVPIDDPYETLPSLITEERDESLYQEMDKVIAKIQCRYISKYTPPVLTSVPIEDDSKSSFSFWGSRSESTKPRSLFNKDDKCSTPYGCGTVIDYRESSGVVVLSMSGWSATSYLNAESVKIVSAGFFNRMLRIMSTETSKTSQQKSPSQKQAPVPYAMDSLMCTPFGEGQVVRPLKNSGVDGVASNAVSSPVQKKGMVDNEEKTYEPDTIAISLSSWVLANDASPVLYCTIETAQSWKAIYGEETSKHSGGMLSAFGSIVSKSVKKLIVGKSKKKSAEVPSVIIVPMFERFYSDGAAVVTPFGSGVVNSFRELDGMYVVELQSWLLADGHAAKIYAMKESLIHQIAKSCIEGYPVLTSLGLSGTLVSVKPRTSIHVVAVSMGGMLCYLQPKDILRPLKASVNDYVITLFGNGKLVNFRAKDDTYEIELGWGAKLYASAESFDRDNSGDDEIGSGFGIDWMRRLFFRSENLARGGSQQQRSRSNSIASSRTYTSKSAL